MAGVFISYARSSEAAAHRIAEQLRGLGYDVWRDDQLPAHRAYADVIEERLREAHAVVVLWSAEAARSQWVRAEADFARNAGTLVQLSLDGAALPLPFNQIQCVELSAWSGDPRTPGWRTVVASIAELTGSAPRAPTRAQPAATARPTLAVLAFNNLSGDPEMDYFSDGVSEEILLTVSRTANLTVMARASSFQFRGAAKAAGNVAAELKVSHLLDGSVRRSGNRVRIVAELVECAGGTTLWSERFDRELSDVFALQDEIAEAVAAALKITFAPSASVEPVEPQAYDLYLRERHIAVDRLRIAERIDLLERAVAGAPRFAAAWAALSAARVDQVRFGPRPETPFAELEAGVRDAAQAALALDPDNGLAYASLSRLQPWAFYEQREALLAKGLAVAPNDPMALTMMGAFENHVGRTREALGHLRRAYELDPLFPLAADVYGVMLGSTDHPQAYDFYDRWRERWPEHATFSFGVLNRTMFLGEWERFDAVAAFALTHVPDEPSVQGALAFAEPLRRNDPTLAPRVARRLHRTLDETGTVPLPMLMTACVLGLKEEIFAAVEQASFDFMFQADGMDPSVSANPGIIFDRSFFGAVIHDVRFVRLCAKLGLCDYWLATGRWPDCVEWVDYDFKAEARRLAHGDRSHRPQI